MVVFEAGESMRFDDYCISEGIKGVLGVMQHYGMISTIDNNYKSNNTTLYLSNRKWLRAPTAGMFIPKVLNGSKIEKGAIIGIVSDTYAKKNKAN